MEKHVYQNINKTRDGSLRVSAVFQEGSMNLTVFENDTAWNTLITRPELKISADNQKTEFSEYIKNLQKYLEKCHEDVEIKFKDGTLSINVLLKNNMKAVYFTTNLRMVNFSSTVFTLIEKLYEEKNDHCIILEDRLRQFDNLEKIKNSYEVKLNELVQRKQQEDCELHSKFVAILNEKKQHIQHLNDLLNAFRRGRPTVNKPVVSSKAKAQKKKSNSKSKTVTVSENKEELSNSNPSTDEEISNSSEEEYIKISKKTTTEIKSTKREISPIPSTSKDAVVNYSFEEKEEIHLSSSKKVKSNSQNNNFKEITSGSQGKDDDNGYQETPDSQKIELDTQDLLNDML